MALEIEFEDDDAADGEPAEGERLEHGPSRRRWGAYGRALPGPRLLLAATAAAVGITAAAGLDLGREAQQARSRAALFLAPSDSYVIDALPAAPPTAESTDERTILLRVLNDGPRPVTVLGGTLYGPDIAASRLVPDAGGGALKPGAVGALRAVSQVACGGGPHEDTDATLAEVSFATVADIELRTADGLVRRVRIIVQQYSPLAELDVCGFPGPRS